MHCFIYKSLQRDGLYLYLLREDDFADVPASLVQSLGRTELVMPLELTPERKLVRADVVQVIEQLQAQGYYVQLPPTTASLLDRLH